MKYVHRHCLEKWRASAREENRPAEFRCETCHFEYQYHRVWLAALLRNGMLRFAIYLTTIMSLCYGAGYIPDLLERLNGDGEVAPELEPLDRMYNGLLILGAIGVVSSAVLACCGCPNHSPTLCDLWRVVSANPDPSPGVRCCAFCLISPCYVVMIGLNFATAPGRLAVHLVCTYLERLVRLVENVE